MRVRFPLAAPELPLCVWCNVNRVKLKKNKTCSRSCGSAKRWYELSQKPGWLSKMKAGERAAKKTRMHQRLQAEIEQSCKELNIIYTSEIRKLYIKARNKGYHNGFYTGKQRGRKGE